MLPDFERKIMQILGNFTHGPKRRLPRMDELMKYTGHTKADVLKALDYLERERYIQRDRTKPGLAIIVIPRVEEKPYKFGDELKYWPD